MVILGIDIGGSGIKGGLVDIETGALVTQRYRLPTPENAKPEECALVVEEIRKYFQYSGPIGVGFPAVVLHGVCKTAANIHDSWIGTNVEQLIHEKTGCSTYVLNDADAAGIAEMTFGAGRERKGVALILTVGTGIGSAIFTDGSLVPNTELGHLELRGKDAEWRASDAARKRKGLTWEEWAVRFQEYLDRIEFLFWPDLIIIGGGMSAKTDRFFPLVKTRAEMIPAQLLNEAGIVGAAMYAQQKSA